MELQRGGLKFTKPALLAGYLEALKDGDYLMVDSPVLPHSVRIEKTVVKGSPMYTVKYGKKEKPFPRNAEESELSGFDLAHRIGSYVENLEQLSTPPRPQNSDYVDLL